MPDGREPNTLDPNLESIQGLTRGAGLTIATTARVFSSEGWGDNANGGASWTTKDEAITNLDFVTFTLDPTTGNEVSFDTLDYKIRRTGSGPSKFIWQYQVGAGTFMDIGTEVEYTTNETAGLFQPQLDLSAISALQDVEDSITFRLVGWNNTGTGSFGIGRNPNTTTPEDVMILAGTAGPIGGMLDGDFNNDGKVDAADYVIWRDEMRPEADYLLWRANFGESSIGSGASAGLSTAVPEPSVAAFLLLGLSSLAFARWRRGR
jgi:hypothetical protein